MIILFNAAWLQLFSSDFRERAEKTTLFKRTLYPSRGIIYDRKGELLVYNEPAYNLEVIYNEVEENLDTTLFCKLLKIDKTTFKNNIEKNWRSPLCNKSIPYTFLKRINPEDFAAFQEHLFKFPGFYPNIRSVRSYPHQNAANVIGYLGEVNLSLIHISEPTRPLYIS